MLKLLGSAVPARALAVLALCLVTLTAVPARAQRFVDADADGIADALDNCWQLANPAQIDSDGDGIGNRCDPDYDGSGLVNLRDLAQMKAAFLTSNPLVDLDGNGFVNLVDLQILKGYFLKPPGPGVWLPPATFACSNARQQARAACCPDYQQGTQTGTVSIPTDCDCSNTPCTPSGFVTLECVPEGSLGQGDVETQCPDEDLIADANGQGGDRACMSALDAAKQACGLSPDQHLDLVGGNEGESQEALPICEAVEDWKEGFTCDPWGDWRPRPWFTGPEKIDWDLHFDPDPSDGVWYPVEPKDPVEDPPFAIDFPFPSAQEANQPVDLIRAEVPGNFARFHLEHGALIPALQQLDELQGVTCDVANLTCDFDVMDLKDLSEDIAQDYNDTGEGIAFDVTKIGSTYVVDNIEATEYDENAVSVHAEYTGKVIISALGTVHVDFDDDAYLGWLPLHDPKGGNGYPTALARPDREGNFLGRAMVVFGLSTPDCQVLANYKVTTPAGSEFAVNGKYYTFHSPYRCRCDSDDPAPDYCVAEVFPRPYELMRDVSGSPINPGDQPDWSFHTVYCSAKDPLGEDPNTLGNEELVAEALALPDQPVGQQSFETPLDSLAAVNGVTNLGQLTQDVRDFACNGQFAVRLPIGPQQDIDLGSLPVEVGNKVSSAIGLRGAAQVAMPTIQAEVTPGVLLIDFDLGWKAEKWFRDEWWTILLGWFVEWILKIFSVIASLLSTLTIDLIQPVSTIELGDVQLLVDVLASHRSIETAVPDNPALKVVTPELDLGVRRVAMNVPTLAVTPLDLAPDFSVPSCELENPEDFVEWALLLFVCPLELSLNLAKFIAAPVTIWFKQMANVLIELFAQPTELIMSTLLPEATNLEGGSNLGGLVAGASRNVTLLPYYLEKDQTPANAPSQLGVDLSSLTPEEAVRRLGAVLPPPFSQLCLGSNAASLNCFLAKMFLGSADPRVPQLDVVRMGAKTHYRSLAGITTGFPITQQDYQSAGLDWDYPPVRYCVEGDTPPGGVAYGGDLLALASPDQYLDFEADELLDLTSDFDEIEVSSEGDPTPTDWRSQCAAFADVKITTLYFVRGIPNPFQPGTTFQAELLVQPTKRTNFLLNEVFFCQDDASCDPSLPNAPLRARAELAVCSMLADVWWRTCSTPACPGNPPYENLLQDVTTDPQAVQWVTGILQQLAAQAGTPELSQVVQTVGTKLPQCVGDLGAKGYSVPTQYVPAP
jgi:hypothetical protein